MEQKKQMFKEAQEKYTTFSLQRREEGAIQADRRPPNEGFKELELLRNYFIQKIYHHLV